MFLNKKNIGEKEYKLIIKSIEIGDFIQAQGKLFLTSQNEKTLKVDKWKIL
ncbi:MAG TPA: lysine--tRNA ligase, partial [Candidatus Moranbacteria bacterium]|nr:lysine--tRNA ligase [Candidatus Moranbacteria bacterium]